jgi:hypothetical protein
LLFLCLFDHFWGEKIVTEMSLFCKFSSVATKFGQKSTFFGVKNDQKVHMTYRREILNFGVKNGQKSRFFRQKMTKNRLKMD